MKTDLPNHASPKPNGELHHPTTDEVVERLDALWAEEREQPKSQLPAFLPERIGRYDVQRLVGRGSFGIVCLARDELLNRDVALKLPRPEVLEDEERMKRFESEARITAALDHPGIVPLYEAALECEHPYLASAFCSGLDLGTWLSKNGGTVSCEDAAILVIQLAEAIHYAHKQGVVHRDLKPTNILLQPRNAETVSPATLNQMVPRITDFGLAKSFGSELIDTRSSMMVGTPLYMAPEQVDTNSQESSAPSVDTYALGCILFELVTGRTPIQGETYVEVVDGLRNKTATRLRTLRPEVSRDLENICAKCLEKRPTDRYETVMDLEDDLKRFLIGKEVKARPIPVARRIFRNLASRPLLTALGALALVSLLVSIIVASRYYRDIDVFEASLNTAKTEAEHSRSEVKQLNSSLTKIRYVDCLAAAYEAFEKGDIVGARAQLSQYDPNKHGEQTFAWRSLDFLTSYSEPLVLRGHEGPVREVAMLPGKRQLVSVGDDGSIRIWDCDTGALIDSIQASQRQLSSLAVSPDGRTVATGNTSLTLWDLSTKHGTPLNVSFETTIEEAVFSKDGSTLVCGARNWGIQILTLATGQRIEIDSESGNESLFISNGQVFGIDSPGSTRHLYSWDVATGKEELEYRAPFGTAVGLAALCEEKGLLAIGNVHAGEMVICNLEGGGERWRSARRPDSFGDICFSTDGALLLAGRQDGVLCYWNLDDCLRKDNLAVVMSKLNSVSEIPAHKSRITSICCVDVRRVATASVDGEIKIWTLSDRLYNLQKVSPEVHRVEIVPGTNDIIQVSMNRDMKRFCPFPENEVWRVDSPYQRKKGERRRGLARVSGSGRYLAAFGLNDSIDVYSVSNGNLLSTYQLGNTLKSVDFSPDDRFLAATGVDGHVSVWDLTTETQVFRHQLSDWGLAIRFSPTGEFLAFGGRVPHTLLVRTDDWGVHGRLSATSGAISIAFDPSGAEIATAHRDGVIRLWNPLTKAHITQLLSQTRPDNLAYHPTDGTLVSSGGGGVMFWDARTRRRLGTILPPQKNTQVPTIQFDDTGSKLICLFQARKPGSWMNRLLVFETDGDR